MAQPGRREVRVSFGGLTMVPARGDVLLQIPAEAFQPPPKVDSALVNFHMPGERARRAIENEQAFLDFVKECFRQKRKTLRNNLRARLGTRTAEVLREAGLAPDARAEQLTISPICSPISIDDVAITVGSPLLLPPDFSAFLMFPLRPLC